MTLASLADLPALVETPRKSLLPTKNFLPCALIEEVVHRNHALDGSDIGISITLAQQRIVHLLRRRVLPVAIARALGDG
ncbi:hypothetical protein HG531_005495 [Fusarium graminearum]|nr:hypothetical protein HG531_005495 [Fusarium graminearum]